MTKATIASDPISCSCRAPPDAHRRRYNQSPPNTERLSLNKPIASSLLASRPGVAALPSVDRVLGLAFVPSLFGSYGRAAVNDTIRALLAEKRQAILDGAAPESVWPTGEQWIQT